MRDTDPLKCTGRVTAFLLPVVISYRSSRHRILLTSWANTGVCDIDQRIYNFATYLLAITCAIALGTWVVRAAPGDLDSSFGTGGKVVTTGMGAIADIALQPDGKIVAVGGGRIVRYEANGSLDRSFGVSGTAIIELGDNTSVFAHSVAIQADGKIVVAGGSFNAATRYGLAVARYHPNGTVDSTFNGTGNIISPAGNQGGSALGLAIQADGKLVVAGYGYTSGTFSSAVLRYSPNGSLDTSFNGTGSIIAPNSIANSVTIQPDGKIISVGSQVVDNYQFTISRYNGNGSPDTSFGGTGQVTVYSDGGGSAYELAIQPDGKIVTIGRILFDENTDAFLLTRHNPNGAPDTTFGEKGGVYEVYFGQSNPEVAIQPDGRIVTTGSIYNDVDRDFAVTRRNADGSRDMTFGEGGIVTTQFGFYESAVAVAIQPDGRILAAGSVIQPDGGGNSISHFAMARYQGGSSFRTGYDFDGDGRADVSVFRPSDRTWYLNRSTNGFSATQWGLSTDKLTPADYDGDGKTDIAVYRAGMWYWLNSSDNSFNAFQFGIAADIPVPANYYTGDGGRSELAVYRNGTWWILNPADNRVSTIQFGLETDIPVAADYDADGRVDQAVYRNGEWHTNRSTEGYRVVSWGLATDTPVQADYDGDGRADPAVYRSGTWYLLQSAQGSAAFNWGIASDIPAPADYDGDGRADAAVYRDGMWYLLQTTSGVSIQQFGLANDRPIASRF
jgi:uncharacterized delta-60 repeat protein